jgi:hypothetical protein
MQFAVPRFLGTSDREGEIVLYCEHLQTVKYRNPADFAGKTEK